MENVERIGFDFFGNTFDLFPVLQYGDDIIIADLLNSPERKIEKGLPLRTEALWIVMVRKGEMKLNINYVPHIVTENSFMLLTEKYILQRTSVSEDFEGHYLIVEPTYFRSILNNEQPLITGSLRLLLKSPIVQLNSDEFDILRNSLKHLRWNMQRSGHTYQAKLVANALQNFIYEIWYFRILKSGNDVEEKKEGNREVIAAKFFRLLFAHNSKEREVAFYAEKLCVSPVYLSRSIKHVVGFPAIKIITNMVIYDATKLLRQPNVTVQQVAEELNFPDQASFSKYFKKNTGKSPMQYRESNKNLTHSISISQIPQARSSSTKAEAQPKSVSL